MKKKLGTLRLDKIKRVHVNDFIEKRRMSGLSARMVNLEVIALRDVLKRAMM